MTYAQNNNQIGELWEVTFLLVSAVQARSISFDLLTTLGART